MATAAHFNPSFGAGAAEDGDLSARHGQRIRVGARARVRVRVRARVRARARARVRANSNPNPNQRSCRARPPERTSPTSW
jgi:hypothetical protein